MMVSRPSLLVSFLALILAASITSANEVDPDRIENIRVAGVSLSDGAEAAFNTLVAAGYNTDVETYDEWRQAGRSFLKGDPNSPSSSPDGYTEIVLLRNGHRLISISLTYINMRNPMNVEEEHQRVRTALGLPVDAPRCSVAGNYASCAAHDADDTVTYTFQILAGRQRYETAGRRGEPPAGLDD